MQYGDIFQNWFHCGSFFELVINNKYKKQNFTIATLASTFFICATRSLISDVSSFISEFISHSTCKTRLIRSGLFKPFIVASLWTIAIKTFQKTHKKPALLTRHKVVKTYFTSFVVKKHVHQLTQSPNLIQH